MSDMWISERMLEDHKRIEKKLLELSEIITKEPDKAGQAFRDFKWAFHNHIAIEENAIFQGLTTSEVSEYGKIRDVINEHRELLEMLETIEKDIGSGKEISMDNFAARLLEHRDFEDNTLYPMLDQQLDEGHKKMILARIEKA